MSQGWGQQVEELFVRAGDLGEEERQAFLDRHCEGNDGLREAILDLLAAEREAGRFLGELDSPESHPGIFRPGQILGAYRLGSVLGEGGMSTVYRADRFDGAFERQVVIKVVRRGMESPGSLERLRLERKILATLEHPHIARLYDGGATANQAPYFAMELVEGEPIDSYCDRRNLGVDQRLHLVRQVCSAVAYAHRHLVVHRDLKPSNILVTGTGEAKLLDFGIAKLLVSSRDAKEETAAAPWRRQLRVRLLTPQYASPEQIRGKTVSTASDIYSLGVLLYRLLTGKLPFSLAGRSLDQLEEEIFGNPPAKPSEAASAPTGVATNEVAAGEKEKGSSKGTELRGSSSSLRGDLDAIVLRCLQVDPARRYSSVERLEEDLRRYLEGLPVRARGNSRAYRTGKFLLRHRLGVAASMAILALVVAQMVTMARHGRAMEEQRDRVTHAFERKEKTIELTQELFRVAAEGEALSVGQAADRASARLERVFGDDPVVRAELAHTAGTIFLNLGAPGKAFELLSQAEEIRRQTFGAQSLERAATLSSLGVARTFATSLALDPEQMEEQAQQGLEDAKQAVDTYREALEPMDGRLVRPLNHLVITLCRLEDYANADAPSLEALDLATATLGEEDPERARAAANRVSVRLGLEGADELLSAYRTTLYLLEKAFGEEHPETSVMINNLGLALWRKGELEEAESYLRRAVSITEALAGKGSPEVALPRRNLGSLLLALDRPQEALEISSIAREILVTSRDYGPGYGLTAACSADVASALNLLGRFQEVPSLLQEELVIWRSRGQGAFPLALLESALGESLALAGKKQQAKEYLSRSLAVLVAARGEEYPDARRTRSRLAAVH